MTDALPLGDPTTTAVVFIECQNGVFKQDAAIPALRDELDAQVDRLVDLAGAARAAGVLTVHATCEGMAGGQPPTTAPLYRLIGPATAEWQPGHPATKVIDELLDPRDLLISRRRGLVPTYNTDLLAILRARGIRTIVFAGVSTNIAIPASVAQATEDGFTVVIPRDAVSGTPKEYSDAVVKNTLAMLATITDIAALKAHWKG
jgi:nicotinamidase-related amidase